MDVRESFQMAGRQPNTRYTAKAATPATLNGIFLPATAPMNSVPMMVVSEGKPLDQADGHRVGVGERRAEGGQGGRDRTGAGDHEVERIDPPSLFHVQGLCHT